MNISQPVASSLGSIHFGVLSSEEIKHISAKRIQNPETFDTLLHPTPGGLYDLALGAWGDYICSTCDLKVFVCPGHAGHIELPLPVYHATYMDQLMRLLNAQCPFCYHFRISRVSVNRYICKLRLLKYGLIIESKKVDELENADNSGGNGYDNDGDGDFNEEDIIRRQEKFVKHAIAKAGFRKSKAGLTPKVVEAAGEERRLVLTALLGELPHKSKCSICNGQPYKWRKDKFSKIFRDTRQAKGANPVNDMGQRVENPIMLAIQAKKAAEIEKEIDRSVDEAIDIDSDDHSGEDGPENAPAGEDTGTSMFDVSATTEVGRHKKDTGSQNEYVNPREVLAYLEMLFQKEKELLTLMYNTSDDGKTRGPTLPSIFFIETLLVPPNKYRPEAKSGGQITEAQQNSLYRRILAACRALHLIQLELKGEVNSEHRQRDFNDLQTSWVTLQDSVNALLNSDHNVNGKRGNQTVEEGIKQRLEKKEGLFRMNMMGKRVNFAARSVISPDPNIETNQIGVPLVFAKKLTFPEPVNSHNLDELRAAVENGPDQYPGASAIENENGQVVSLLAKSRSERMALANGLDSASSVSVTGTKKKKVHRHLKTGDIMIMNRQPTLHKPSMMCHWARVLQNEKTIRMHYANCNTYNADFDGDEMNMHFPQSQIARAEAMNIADTDHQYLVATSGKPLRGLIQDHLSMGVWLTNRDTVFTRGDYQQLLYSCLRPEDNHTTSDRILTVPPAIVKPIPMWTGKQVITTVLKNIKPEDYPGITMTGRSSTSAEAWGEGSEERDVIFRQGDFLCGILDKAHMGPTHGGLVHSVYEAYGHTTAGKLLSVLGRLLTKFLHMRAWSCGVEDIVLSRAGDATRLQTLKDASVIGLQCASKYVSLPELSNADDPGLKARLFDVIRDKDKHAGLDSVTSTGNAKLSSAVTAACLPKGLWKPFPRNHMQTMTVSGAKGSIVNANQISCNLGQQTLEGRRVPVMISGKTLPSFKPLETDIRAGGYIVNRFLTGVQPQSYYFHAMAGREGLIDTAVKTARSGYLQRCIIKGMEGLRVEYDTTVRDSDGSLVQFLYGEDGLDVIKQKHLQDFKFIGQNLYSFATNLNVHEWMPRFEDRKASKLSAQNLKALASGKKSAGDPVTTLFNPGSNLGSTSEAFALALKKYIQNNPDGLIRDKSKTGDEKISKKSFQSLMELKYLNSVVDPGEAVGIVAGQSIGEPSTQMTLNTFHLAGHAAKNVTLGIPRLREIVMTASAKILTPTMTMHLNPEIDSEAGEKFAKGISKLSMAEVLESIQVKEVIQNSRQYDRARAYHVTLHFYPKEEIEEEYAISINDISKAVETSFMPILMKAIKKDVNAKAQAERASQNLQVGVAMRPLERQAAAGGDEDGDGPTGAEPVDQAQDEDVDSEEDNGPDEDTTQAKMRSKVVDNYEDEDDEDGAQSDTSSVDEPAAPAEEPEDEGYVGSPRSNSADPMDTLSEEVSTFEARVLNLNHSLTKFKMRLESDNKCTFCVEQSLTEHKVIMLNHVEAACRTTLIQHIPGVGACTLSEEKYKDPKTGEESNVAVVITEGINLVAMRDYQDEINPHRMFSNDVHAMLSYYGVEAARATIVREMSAVFEGHSITVDNRHLNLIGDMMTRHGTFVPFNRFGMKSSTSPFMRMSFETTMGFLKDAVLAAEIDDLSNPSARIVAGRTSTVGTGSFDVLVPVSKTK